MPYTPEQRELLNRARAACADGTIELPLYSAAIAIMRQGRYAALQAAASKARKPRKTKAVKAPAESLLDQTTTQGDAS